MDATTSGPVQKPASDQLKKPPRPRSKPYPAFTIDHCVTFAQKVDTAFSSIGFTPQASISKTLEQSGGGFLTLLSSCVQYGLLDKSTGDGYKPSELFKKISRPLPGEKIEDSKLECFRTPTLYTAIIQAYAGKQVPAEAGLANILDRLHFVIGDASILASKVFYKNAKALKVLDDNNVLRLSSNAPPVEERKEEEEQAQPDVQSHNQTHQPPPNHPPVVLQLPPSTFKEIPIVLKNKGEAKLLLPPDADDDDLKRIIKVLTAYVE